MNFGVIVFPGSNCDDDMIHVLGTVMGSNVKKIWHKETSLGDLSTDDCIVLPGGFSYGDYLRSGAIASFSPIMQAVINHAHNGGYVLGICNGFQILCEANLLPGALLRNEHQKFICKNVFLEVSQNTSRFTHHCDQGAILKIPIAHAEGRFYADRETLQQLESNQQILFKYCNKNGQIDETSNINGSAMNIAGICNNQGNVFGMMPHPERASEDALGNADGRILFESLISSQILNAV